MDASDANTLAQTSIPPGSNWEHADVAGGLMAFIGGLFQGIGITETFFAGREQKEELYTFIREQGKSTRAETELATDAVHNTIHGDPSDDDHYNFDDLSDEHYSN